MLELQNSQNFCHHACLTVSDGSGHLERQKSLDADGGVGVDDIGVGGEEAHNPVERRHRLHFGDLRPEGGQEPEGVCF